MEEQLKQRQAKIAERQTKLLIMQRQKEEKELHEQQQMRIEQAQAQALAEEEMSRQLPKRVKDESPRIASAARQIEQQRNAYNGS